jgi:tetratricopeptide (TPR) repeat protein
LGNLLYSQGDLAGAEVHFRRTLEGTRHLFGEEHPSTLDALSNMGGVLRAHGKLSEAERYCIDALEKSRRVLGEEHPDTLISLNEMGALLRDKGQPAEAEPYFREAWSKGRRIQGDLHPLTLAFLFNFGDLLLQQGKYREALQALEAVGHVVDDAKADVRIPRLARVLVLLGRAHMGLTSDPEHHRRAEATLLQTYARLEGAGGEADGTTLDCVQALLDLYTAWNAAEPGKGHDAKAEEWKKKLEEGKPEPAKDPAPESP